MDRQHNMFCFRNVLKCDTSLMNVLKYRVVNNCKAFEIDDTWMCCHCLVCTDCHRTPIYHILMFEFDTGRKGISDHQCCWVAFAFYVIQQVPLDRSASRFGYQAPESANGLLWVFPACFGLNTSPIAYRYKTSCSSLDICEYVPADEACIDQLCSVNAEESKIFNYMKSRA